MGAAAFDYQGSLRVRVMACGAVRADDVISDEMPDARLEAVSAAHEAVARRWLAEGATVELEARHLDGSLYQLTVLTPRSDVPAGFEITYRGESNP